MASGQVEDKDFVVLVSSHLCIDVVCVNVFESKITFGDSIDSDKKIIRSLLNTVKLYDDNKPWARTFFRQRANVKAGVRLSVVVFSRTLERTVKGSSPVHALKF